MDYFIEDAQARIMLTQSRLNEGGLSKEEELYLKDKLKGYIKLKEFLTKLKQDIHNKEVCQNVEMVM